LTNILANIGDRKQYLLLGEVNYSYHLGIVTPFSAKAGAYMSYAAYVFSFFVF